MKTWLCSDNKTFKNYRFMRLLTAMCSLKIMPFESASKFSFEKLDINKLPKHAVLHWCQWFSNCFCSGWVPYLLDSKSSKLKILNFRSSYSKCFNWRQISKLSSTFGCLFTFCYSAWATLIKTKLQNCNWQTGQFISYKYVNQFWLNLPHPNGKK